MIVKFHKRKAFVTRGKLLFIEEKKEGWKVVDLREKPISHEHVWSIRVYNEIVLPIYRVKLRSGITCVEHAYGR